MLLLCKRLPEGLFVTSHLQEVMLRYLRSFPDESSKLADMIEMCRMIHGINMFFFFFYGQWFYLSIPFGNLGIWIFGQMFNNCIWMYLGCLRCGPTHLQVIWDRPIFAITNSSQCWFSISWSGALFFAEPKSWNPGTLEPAVGLQSWVSVVNRIP